MGHAVCHYNRITPEPETVSAALWMWQIEIGIANGKTTPQACQEAEINIQTFYRWRKEYGGFGVGGSLAWVLFLTILPLSGERFCSHRGFYTSGKANPENERTKVSSNFEFARAGENLDAPSWLWTSVVQLLASHESAYLEHCR